jgi:hypothetical protein
MSTALSIIKGALGLINVLGQGEALNNFDSNEAFAILNDIIRVWNLNNLMLYKIQKIIGTLIAGQNPHTIGPSGANITTARPVRIERAFTRLPTASNPVDYQMDQVDSNRYDEIIVKSIGTSYPNVFYYSPDYPNGNIYTYPVQSQQNLEIHISAWMQLSEIAQISDSIDLPYAYDVALKYQLAVDISSRYGKQLVKGDNVFDKAAELRSTIKRVNQPNNNILLDSALMSGWNRGFSILRGF